MADGSATRAPVEASGSGWRATATDPAVVAVVVYTVAALVAAVAAYFTIFTVFAPYDDEGTLLVTLKAFVHGDVLYRDIYSEYGPFYYEVFGGLFALTGRAVTTDAGRSIVVIVWVASSLLFGLSVQRLTGRLALGIVGMAAAFATLHVLANEPMHPEGLSVLLLAAFVFLAVSEPSRRVGWTGAACGALLAALTLAKLNLGIFAVAAVVLAAVWTVEPLYRVRWLRWAVVAAFLAMPLLITARDLNVGWTRELLVLELLAMTALLAAAWPLRPTRGEAGSPVTRWLLAAAAAFALTAVAIFGIIFLTGPSPADVYDGLVVQAQRVRDVLVSQFPFPTSVLDWGVAALAAAVLVTRLRPSATGNQSVWPAVLRTLAGLTILFTVSGITPLAIAPSASNPDALPMLLAWVAAIPPAGPPEPSYRRFLRLLLPALAIAETLQVYPVAGSQMWIAAVTFVPVGGLCIGDGLASLRAWTDARGKRTIERVGVVVSVAGVALAAQFSLDALVRPAVDNVAVYNAQEALPFPGATTLHLPASEVETFSHLVELLHSHRCTSFIGYPNIDSLYLWSGIEAPPPAAPGAWMKALDSARQQRVVDELRATPRPCAIRSNGRAEAWLGGAPPPDTPLVRYVLDEFEPVANVAEFEFALPKARASSDTPSQER